jgi:hypothetical protein
MPTNPIGGGNNDIFRQIGGFTGPQQPRRASLEQAKTDAGREAARDPALARTQDGFDPSEPFASIGGFTGRRDSAPVPTPGAETVVRPDPAPELWSPTRPGVENFDPKEPFASIGGFTGRTTDVPAQPEPGARPADASPPSTQDHVPNGFDPNNPFGSIGGFVGS